MSKIAPNRRSNLTPPTPSQSSSLTSPTSSQNPSLKSKKSLTKSKRLRPVRVVLAVLVVTFLILVLKVAFITPRTKTERILSAEKISDKNPTTPDKNPTTSIEIPTSTPDKSAEISANPSDKSVFLDLSPLIDVFEDSLATRLESLGISEEEYNNLAGYLEKDELILLDANASLVLEFSGTWVEVDASSFAELSNVLGLESVSLADFETSKVPPADYKILTDLLAAREKSLSTVEDYDVVE